MRKSKHNLNENSKSGKRKSSSEDSEESKEGEEGELEDEEQDERPSIGAKIPATRPRRLIAPIRMVSSYPTYVQIRESIILSIYSMHNGFFRTAVIHLDI